MYVFKGNLLKLKLDSGYELVEHPGAAACIIKDNNNRIILVRQYRKALKEYTWEIPAGKIDKNDNDPINTVIREVNEEAGIELKPENLIYLGKIYTTPGFSNEIIYIFFTEIKEYNNLQPQDTNEINELKFFPKEELFELIYKNEIKDSKTLSSITMAIARNLL